SRSLSPTRRRQRFSSASAVWVTWTDPIELNGSGPALAGSLDVAKVAQMLGDLALSDLADRRPIRRVVAPIIPRRAEGSEPLRKIRPGRPQVTVLPGV